MQTMYDARGKDEVR